jgi:hypothetical protein
MRRRGARTLGMGNGASRAGSPSNAIERIPRLRDTTGGGDSPTPRFRRWGARDNGHQPSRHCVHDRTGGAFKGDERDGFMANCLDPQSAGKTSNPQEKMRRCNAQASASKLFAFRRHQFIADGVENSQCPLALTNLSISSHLCSTKLVAGPRFELTGAAADVAEG